MISLVNTPNPDIKATGCLPEGFTVGAASVVVAIDPTVGATVDP